MNKKREDFEKSKEHINKQLNKHADKIVVSMYTPEKEPERNEGDFWLDKDGKQWTVQNGIKQSLSPLQDAKTPWWCPICQKTLDQRDLKSFRVHVKCFDCVVNEETRMKIDGVWNEYVEKNNLKNQIAFLQERLVELTYYYETITNPEVYHFDDKTGAVLMIDKFSISLDVVKKDMMKNIIDVNQNLKKLECEYNEKFENITNV